MHRHVDMLASTGQAPHFQGCQGAVRSVQTRQLGRLVAGSVARRFVVVALNIQQAAHCLSHKLRTLKLGIRTGLSEGRYRREDQRRVPLFKSIVSDA